MKVTGIVIVYPHITLTINPGIIVEFHDHYHLEIFGMLHANGTETDSITFTAKYEITIARTIDKITRTGIKLNLEFTNLFIVADGKLITHPLTPDILPGITRAKVLEICVEQNLHVSEQFYNKETLLKSDEVFLTGTITEVLSIVEIDGFKIGNGKVGTITKKLFDALRARSKQK